MSLPHTLPGLIITAVVLIYGYSLMSDNPTYSELQNTQSNFTQHASSLTNPDNENHDITIAGSVVPYLGDIFYFLSNFISMISDLVSLVWNYMVAILSLPSLFPEWMSPIFLIFGILTVIAIFKLLRGIS